MKTTFTARVTRILAEWLNEVNTAVFDAIGDGTNAPTTPAEVRTNIGAGDVTGPASSTDAMPAVFDGTTGKLLKNTTASAIRTTLDVPSNSEAVLDTIIDAKGDLVVGTAADTPARKAVGTDGTVLLADSSQSDGLQWAGGFSRKNLIIGGNFTTNPWQRGGTFTSIANAAYCADRWVFGNTSAAVLDAIGVGDSPTAAEAGVYSTTCLELDVTTADATLAAGDLCFIGQYVEGVNIAHMGFGQSGTRYMTLSFWHKHTKTGTHCVALRNSAADRSYIAEYTQAVTNTWEKATITFAVDTSGTWLYDTGIGLRLTFALAAGTTYQTAADTWTAGNYLCTANQVNNLDSTSNDFKIALVQLEAGTVATEFENLMAQDVLTLCQRYYEKTFALSVAPAQGAGWNGALSGTVPIGDTLIAQVNWQFKVRKRASPTVVTYNPTQANGEFRNESDTGNASGTGIVTPGGASETSVVVRGSGSAQNPYYIQMTAEAELG